MSINDYRKKGLRRAHINRQKFIKRHLSKIKEYVDQVVTKKSIKEVSKKIMKVPIPQDNEPWFNHSDSGNRKIVVPDNHHFKKGDGINRNGGSSNGNGAGGGSGDSGIGEDDFYFHLSREEFLNIYFSNMALPDFVKKSFKDIVQYKRQRAGYTKHNIPACMNIKKTFEQAIARRISTKAQGKKPAYLDDEDIRYNNFVMRPYPIRTAVMVCVMDVSGSMSEWHKTVSKKFFILLYLFLTREYQKVEVIFVKHHTEAKECSEREFFYDRETGGTIVSSALMLVKDIMKRYDLSQTNFYVSQASDGDNWGVDNEFMCNILVNNILPVVQYYAYIQIGKSEYEDCLYNVFQHIQKSAPNGGKMGLSVVEDESDVYPALAGLFKKENV